jgi:hypothetical protein
MEQQNIKKFVETIDDSEMPIIEKHKLLKEISEMFYGIRISLNILDKCELPLPNWSVVPGFKQPVQSLMLFTKHYPNGITFTCA